MTVRAHDGVTCDVQTERQVHSLQTFRRTYYRAVKGGMKDAAMHWIVPRVKKGAAPTKLRGLITAVAPRTNQVVITTKGSVKNSRIIGLQNYGGTLPRPIYPKRRLAIRVGNTGEVRSVVRGTARITGKHFVERGIDAGLPRFREEVGTAIMRRLQAAFGGR